MYRNLTLSLILLVLVQGAFIAWLWIDRNSLLQGVIPVRPEVHAAHRIPDTDSATEINPWEAKALAFEDRIRELEADLAAQALLLAQTQDHNEAMEEEFSALEEELLFTYGTPREAGTFMGDLVKQMMDLSKYPQGSPEFMAIAQNMSMSLLSLGPLLDEMDSLEANSAAFTDFQSSFISSFIEFSDGQREQIESIIQRAKLESIAATQGDDIFNTWNAWANDEIRAVLTPEQQAIYETLLSTPDDGPLILPLSGMKEAMVQFSGPPPPPQVDPDL